MAEAVIVCGYGCHLDTPLRPYLDRVTRFILEHNPYLVVFCGGYTQKKSAPGWSEASLMATYVTEELIAKRYNSTAFFEMEADSYTTYENLQKAAAILREKFDCSIGALPFDHITIFCEAQKAPVVLMLARHFMAGNVCEPLDNITVETGSWERQDPFKQWRKLLYNRLAIKFPFLARRERRKRLARSAQI